MKTEYHLLKGLAIELASKKDKQSMTELSTVIRRLKTINQYEPTKNKGLYK